VARRSIAAIQDLPAGHVLALEDLMWIRPAGGVKPGQETMLVGRRLRRAVLAADRILPDDVQ
jgi:sialic acid synthase SpsE